ncbi:MAG TPA: haloacid dehalogenase type II [Ktedonobacterales bacterium]
MALDEVKALTFDVFGTVVDWRGSIIAEGERLRAETGLALDRLDLPDFWGRFADAWRRRYHPSMERVMRGELPWTNLDALHRASLDEVLGEFGMIGLTDSQKDNLNLVWHRLLPWPDSVVGLTRLRQRFILATLSNGNVRLLVDMAKRADLPWDVILSAELALAYKPDPRVYRMAAELLELEPSEILMVAAHPSDLQAAAIQGMRTAFVPRLLEYGQDAARDVTSDLASDSQFDLVATDFLDLARQLDSAS